MRPLYGSVVVVCVGRGSPGGAGVGCGVCLAGVEGPPAADEPWAWAVAVMVLAATHPRPSPDN